MAVFLLQQSLPITSATDAEAAQHLLASAWQWVTDFAQWQSWLPGASKVVQLDHGSPGRGTRIQIQRDQSTEFWQVTYWFPTRRVVLQAEAIYPRRTYAFEFQVALDHSIELKLGMECELPGPYRLLGPLLRRQRMGQLRHLARNLQAYLQERLASSPPLQDLVVVNEPTHN